MSNPKPKRAEEDPEFVKHDECPVCLYQCSYATPLVDKGAKAKPRSFALCFNCGAVNRYDDKMNLVIPSEDEFDNLTSDQKNLIDRAKVLRSQMRTQAPKVVINKGHYNE